LKSFGNTSSNSKHLIKYSKDGAAVRAIHPRPERRGFSRNPVNCHHFRLSVMFNYRFCVLEYSST
jgi:hypothetical protein